MAYLLESREQTFPSSKEAGAAFGTALDKSCKADPAPLFLAAAVASDHATVRTSTALLRDE